MDLLCMYISVLFSGMLKIHLLYFFFTVNCDFVKFKSFTHQITIINYNNNNNNIINYKNRHIYMIKVFSSKLSELK